MLFALSFFKHLDVMLTMSFLKMGSKSMIVYINEPLDFYNFVPTMCGE
jgi:hypothetical protein